MGLFKKKTYTVHLDNGNIYTGTLKNHKYITGYGTTFMPDGSAYEGDHVNGVFEGYGTLRKPDGITYTGQFLHGLANGHGKSISENGNWHEGKYKNGEFEGSGILDLKDQYRYEGNFFQSKRNGNGECFFANGDHYKGKWVDDEMDGRGTYTFADGERLNTSFVHGRINVQNVLMTPEQYKQKDSEYTSITSKEVNRPAQKTASEYLEELNSLIGLREVKEKVENLTYLIETQQQRKERGLPVTPMSYHMVFTGNPGTGKTTVARLIGNIYYSLGVIPSNKFIETDRSGLIGEYIGHTETKTNQVIDNALGGILFIDEAYSLTQGKDGNDFGSQAINVLLRRMENERDNLVVIAAGYDEPMDQFITSNPGLKSRFTQFIEFPNYNISECLKIIKYQAEKDGYLLDSKFIVLLHHALEERLKDPSFSKTFSNGRYMRNILQKCRMEQSARLMSSRSDHELSDVELSTITEDDLKNLLRSGEFDTIS